MRPSLRVRLIALAVSLMVLASAAGYIIISGGRSGSLTYVGFNSDTAYDDLAALCNIGPRVPGTPNDVAGAELVAQSFKDAGLTNVHAEEHPVTTYNVNSAALSLIRLGVRTPVIRTYTHLQDFVLYSYSGSTAGDLRLEIIDAGDGSDAAFQNIDVSGKAVLVTMQCLPRAAEKGARAVIVQNIRLAAEYGYPPYAGGLYGSDAEGNSIPYPDAHPDKVVPTCSVSKTVGDEIRAAIEGARRLPVIGSNVQIQLNFDVSIGKNNIYNVVGDVRGSKYPGDYVYFIAHRDSTYISPGAVDDGSGTATIMELARQMAHTKPEKTIRFISLDGEEIGLIGSFEYVKAHSEEVKNHGVLVVNYDMNDCRLDRVGAINTAVSANFSKALNSSIDLMFSKRPDLKKYKINITVGGNGADDAPFKSRGVDNAFAMGGWGSSWEYHTTLDTIEYVSPESWAVSGTMFGILGLHAAGG